MLDHSDSEPSSLSGANGSLESPATDNQKRRNDAISPYILVVIVLFWLLQSTVGSSVIRLFTGNRHGITKVTSSGANSGTPTSVTQGIIQIDLEAKTSYISVSAQLTNTPAAAAMQQTLAQRTKTSRATALADASRLLAQYPDQPALATRVMLLRAETGAVDPLAPVYSPHIRISHLPLDSYKIYDTLPKLQKAPHERDRSLWQALLAPAHIDPARAPALAAEIRAVPNLRWWRNIALHQLYVKDGDQRAARLAMASAVDEAGVSVGASSAIVIVAILVALLGIAGLLIFAGSVVLKIDIPGPFFRPTPQLIADRDRRLGAGDLMNIFTLYLALLLSASLVAPILLKGMISHAEAAGGSAATSFIISAEAVLTLICGSAAVLALAALAKRRGSNLSQEIGLNLGRGPILYTIAFGLLGWGVALPIVVGVAKLSSVVFHNAPSPANPAIPLLMTATGGWVSVVLFILVAVIAPFFEETLFRGIFYNAARLRLGAPSGILLTGAAFGLAHPVGIAEQIPLMALGAVFAWMAETRKSLLPSMCAHCLQNSFVYATLFFSLMTVTPAWS